MSARPWFREPMLALVIGLPAAAVIAGIATVVIAAKSSGDTGDPRVTRVAQVQTADLEMDRAAVRLSLSAVATIAPDGVVSLTPTTGQWPASTLRLTLRHGTDAGRDRELLLARADGLLHVGVLPGPLPAGAYNAELVPAEGGWRLVGRLMDRGTGLRLEPAVAAP